MNKNDVEGKEKSKHSSAKLITLSGLQQIKK